MKGELDPASVVWFTHVDSQHCNGWHEMLFQRTRAPALPIFTEAKRYRPGLPVYSFPFKEAPMSADEYMQRTDSALLQPLYVTNLSDDDDSSNEMVDGGDDPDYDDNRSIHSRVSPGFVSR